MRNGDEVRVLCCLKFFLPQAKLVDVKMGNSQSGKSECSSPVSTPQHQLHLPAVELPRTHNLRASIRTKIPMPDKSELERRFTKVLVRSMCKPIFHLNIFVNRQAPIELFCKFNLYCQPFVYR